MRFSVINGEVNIGNISAPEIAASSTFIIGDVRNVDLASMFETPAEELIVGVTLPPFARPLQAEELDPNE